MIRFVITGAARDLLRQESRCLASLVMTVLLTTAAHSQDVVPDSVALPKAMQLEIDGKYHESAKYYRMGLNGAEAENALLGLERVYAELSWTDSLLGPLDTLIRRDPSNHIYRVAQLRSLTTLNRDAALRQAFENWTQAAPKDATPYSEYAKILIQKNRTSTADTIIRQGEKALGSIRGLEMQTAQVRASTGEWVASAQAWRAAMAFSPELDQAVAYSLAPTPPPVRDSVRAVFTATPVTVPVRMALSRLEANWGSAANGWRPLRDLPPDSAAVDAWIDFAERAEAEGDWNVAREALVFSLKARPSAKLSFRAATAAMNAGDAMEVLTLIPLSSAGADSAKIAATYVPLHVRALATIGRAESAQRLATAFDKWFPPPIRNSVTRTVAWGWVRQGDMEKARLALSAIGSEADSSDTAGWLALYGGDIRTARSLLRSSSESTPELALALGTVARIKLDRAPAVGSAFLTLARGDTAGAARGFVAAANETPDAASTLLSIGAQLYSAKQSDSTAIEIWKQIVSKYPDSAEAPEADLAWARSLIRKKDSKGAIERLEHLILTYPTSALLPQARRELDLAKRIIP
jgi:tetratricopeptide (TPR) repeat protein